MSVKTAVIIGIGPGLGLSLARRFGAAGYRVAMVSRGSERHAMYLADLAERGVEASAHVADVTDSVEFGEVIADIAKSGEIEFVYYGPALMQQPRPITELEVATAQAAFEVVWPAVQVVHSVLPGMLARGSGGLLFAGGLSSVRPMPMLGQLALPSAALRNYALTLHAALSDQGVYAGTLTIGGLIERGDIHAMVTANPGQLGATASATIDPDDIAEVAWRMFRDRDRAETTFDVLGDKAVDQAAVDQAAVDQAAVDQAAVDQA